AAGAGDEHDLAVDVFVHGSSGVGGRGSVGRGRRGGPHPAQDHAAVVQDAVDELAIGGEAAVVQVVHVVAADRVAVLVGAAEVAAGLVVAAVGTQLVAD